MGVVEDKYVTKWEESRQSLNMLNLNNQVQDCLVDIKKTTNKLEGEHRIHSEIKLYIKEITKELTSQLINWKQKYEDGIEQFEADLLKLNLKRTKLELKRQSLSVTYEKHNEEIQKYYTYKGEIVLKQVMEMLRHKAAIKIQRWWRNVMIVKKLGIYKPLPKKKKRKPKKNKNKNKKQAKNT